MNFSATARSNYFRVKDEEKFKEWVGATSLKILTGSRKSEPDKAGVRRFAIAPGDYCEGGWPSTLYDEETDEDRDVDVAEELAEHLADDEVAILMEAGSEGERYVTGWAVAVNNKGGYEQVGLDDIYKKAAHLGENITQAEY